MNIEELTKAIGSDNINIQSLENSFSKTDYSKKHGCVFVTFGTPAITLDDLLSEYPFRNKIGLILWMDREKYDQAIKSPAEEEKSIQEKYDRLRSTVVEFLSDWRKGDFELPKLAQYDATSMEEALK